MNYVIAEPVNYQMYCLGWLELEELYAKAQEAQGEAFDEVAFHEERTANRPLSVCYSAEVCAALGGALYK